MRTATSFAGAAFAAALLLIAGPAFADGPAQDTPDVAAPPVRAAPVTPAPVADPASAPAGRSGAIALPGGDIALNVPDGYRYYTADVAQGFVQRTGAMAPPGIVLGLLAPAHTDVRAPDAWATVLSYDAIGHVAPETASGLSSSSFEADVRTARASQNRTFEGFAVQPAFDSATPSLSWAERTAAPGAGGAKDFRHEQRVLGRRGVAGLTSIGTADQMGAIVTAAPDMLSMISFPAGQTHADFDPAADAASAYGVPSLITGLSTSNPQAVADIASAGGDQGSSGSAGLQGMFPWIALGVAGLAGLGWFLTRRRAAAGDPNLGPDDE